MTDAEIEIEAKIRHRTLQLQHEEAFECRVNQLKTLILADYEFDWPYTDAFDDGGVAYHEAKRRIAEG